MVWDVAWLSAVILGCRQRLLGIVVGELVSDGADHGTDPLGKAALTLSFRRGVRVESGGGRAAADWAPNISRMGEMGGRERRV